VTLALNLHAQGVDPMIDLSDIDEVRRVVEHCNRLPVPERHPYAGDLVYTAFSGTHQDAINKGMAHHAKRAADLGVPPEQAPWEVPYLPIDPADVGRGYQAVIRVNSQSGKGGIAYLLHTRYGLELPRRLQIDFSSVVQQATDGSGEEITAEQLWELFHATYLAPGEIGALADWSTVETGPGAHEFTGTLRNGRRLSGTGNGPLSALTAALAGDGIDVDILHYAEHALDPGRGSRAIAYVEAKVNGTTCWGAAQDTSVLTASVHAVLAAVHRAG
jgi:2-isopropylmalate synthase